MQGDVQVAFDVLGKLGRLKNAFDLVLAFSAATCPSPFIFQRVTLKMEKDLLLKMSKKLETIRG